MPNNSYISTLQQPALAHCNSLLVLSDTSYRELQHYSAYRSTNAQTQEILLIKLTSKGFCVTPWSMSAGFTSDAPSVLQIGSAGALFDGVNA
jgi:hypothetical protein